MLWKLLREQERSLHLSPGADHGQLWKIKFLVLQTLIQMNLILSLRDRLMETERNRTGTEFPSSIYVCVLTSAGASTPSWWGCQTHSGPYGHSSKDRVTSACVQSQRGHPLAPLLLPLELRHFRNSAWKTRSLQGSAGFFQPLRSKPEFTRASPRAPAVNQDILYLY